MYTIIAGVELPETEEEISYVEVSGGLDGLVNEFIHVAMELNEDDRKPLALRFAAWVSQHWQLLHSLNLMKIIKCNDTELPNERFRFLFGENANATLEINFPTPTDADKFTRTLSDALASIIEQCGYQDHV